jgi:hypothetical protein
MSKIEEEFLSIIEEYELALAEMAVEKQLSELNLSSEIAYSQYLESRLESSGVGFHKKVRNSNKPDDAGIDSK